MSSSISPTVARPDPRQAFQKLASQSSDGTVSKEQFESLASKDGPSVEKLDKIFEKADVNHDGKLTVDEHDKFLDKVHLSQQAKHLSGGGGPRGGGGPGGPSGAGAKKTYDAADTNEDGTVSAEEQLAYDAKAKIEASESALANPKIDLFA